MNAQLLRSSFTAVAPSVRCLTPQTASLTRPASSAIRSSASIEGRTGSQSRCFQTCHSPQFRSTSTRRAVHEINSKSEFDKVIAEQASPQGVNHKGQVIFIDAFATWCGPCKAIAPIVSRWSEDPQEGLKDKVAFYKFDVDKVPELAQELGVSAMPTFFIFKAGESEPAEQVVGASPPLMRRGIEKVLGTGQ